jgi:hypothetical protein
MTNVNQTMNTYERHSLFNLKLLTRLPYLNKVISRYGFGEIRIVTKFNASFKSTPMRKLWSK